MTLTGKAAAVDSLAVTTQADYRRQARRIRAALADAPARRRVDALRELARRYDAAGGAGGARGAGGAARPAALAAHGAAASFAQVVCDRMDGPVLRYSHRTRLLRDAARRGIGRFEANLIIAAVQHRAETSPGPVPAREPVAARPWIPVVVGFAVTQCVIVAAMWLTVN